VSIASHNCPSGALLTVDECMECELNFFRSDCLQESLGIETVRHIREQRYMRVNRRLRILIADG
jgi:hypothetical protein